MTATTPALASSRRRGSGRHPWLCAHSSPARPRQARTSPVYSIAVARTSLLLSDGRRYDSGSLMGSVMVFGAVAPTSIPSSRPTPDTDSATLGSDSLLQASLRITRLMTHSIGPCPSTGAYGRDRPTGSVDPGGSAEWVDTRVT